MRYTTIDIAALRHGFETEAFRRLGGLRLDNVIQHEFAIVWASVIRTAEHLGSPAAIRDGVRLLAEHLVTSQYEVHYPAEERGAAWKVLGQAKPKPHETEPE